MFGRKPERQPHFPKLTPLITLPRLLNPSTQPCLEPMAGNRRSWSSFCQPRTWAILQESIGIDRNQAAFRSQHRDSESAAEIKGHLPMIPLPPRRPGSSRGIQNTSGSRGELWATTAVDHLASEEVEGGWKKCVVASSLQCPDDRR
jgi:hypothetical protein